MSKKKKSPATVSDPADAEASGTVPGSDRGSRLNLAAESKRDLTVRHVRLGWVLLSFWVTLGLVLESLQGFKVGWYLNLDHETRRMLLRLAHSHGAVFGLLNLAFASLGGGVRAEHSEAASTALCIGTVLMPVGFLLGGLFIHDGDPGLGVLLAPLGGLLVVLGLVLTVKRAWRG